MTFRLLIIILFFFGMASCISRSKTVTNTKDYEKYMQFQSVNYIPSLKRINADIDFWMRRLKKNPEDAVAQSSLGGLYSAKFSMAGNINDIHTSDSLYHLANTLFKVNSSSLYRALAANCITQHKFQEAKSYLDTALVMGDDRYLTLLMMCDVLVELGQLQLAQQSLNQIKDKNEFDYLIREAKLLDHKGDLDAAIKKMEAANQKAIESKKDALYTWAKSNLGDMYGHAGRYEESYQCYLDVLQKKPGYLYALKGIAWLAFSHDRNTKEAKRILNYLAKLHAVPDYDLMLAEIAEYENDKATKEKFLNKYLTAVTDSGYGDMYNKYVFDLMIEKKDVGKALQIAQQEVNNRPTTQSYDLLAWAYYNGGHKDKALEIVKDFVEKRNFEPDALYHLGIIYASIGNYSKAKNYLKQARNSAFELGPSMANEIQIALDDLYGL